MSPVSPANETAPFTPRELDALLRPKSVAVVGASDKPGAGSIVLDNLRQLGFAGPVYPVNPKHEELAGWRCYPRLQDIPQRVDCVAILLSHRHVLQTLQEAAFVGARAAWSLASGFAEAGPEGLGLQREVAEFARAKRIAFCGPNCVGIVNLHACSAMYSVALPRTLKRGSVGAILQSGAVCLGIANSNRGVGFSTLISSGNEAVLDNADYIAYFADDPQTRVIIAFIEGFKNPSHFVEAARRAREAGKPLLVVKIGRSGVAQRATVAHTGSLAGADAVHDAVFREHGIIRLESLDELLEAAELFVKAPMPAGRGVGLLTLSGGQIGLIGDAMQGTDVELPDLSEQGRQALSRVLPPYSNLTNPLDAWGSGNIEETYPACMEIMAQEPGVHLLAVARDSSPGIAPREIWQSNLIVDAAARVVEMHHKPCVVFSNVSTGFEKAVQERADAVGLPLLQGTRASLRAMSALVEYAEYLRRPLRRPAPSPASPETLARIRAHLSKQPANLTERAGMELLVEYGVPVARAGLAATCEEAVSLAEEMGMPVALKVQSPDIQHKTEAGCVVLNVSGVDALRREYHRILKNARAHNPAARIDGMLVQEMISKEAVEVIVGCMQDPEFGPVVVLGMGGVLVELFRDSVLRLAPVSTEEALEMAATLRCGALLRGFRGRPAVDVEALADVVVRLSHLAYDLRNDLAAVDVNPLMALPQGYGVRAADALVIRRHASVTANEARRNA